PYWFTALIILIVIAVYLLAGTAAFLLELPNEGLGLYLIANVALTLVLAALVTATRWWKGIGFQPLANRRDLWLYALPASPVLVQLVSILVLGFAPLTTGSVLTFLLLALLVGFVEETAFRGLILQALAPGGRWQAVIVSSVLFGLVHLMNGLAGSSTVDLLLQLGYTMAFGFGWAAVTLRTRSIGPLVIIHALIDFPAFLTAESAAGSGFDVLMMGMSAVFIVAFVIFGVVQMRSEPQAQQLEASPARL
ncbi:MAG TPA: type II CAAX endopeptidase family protein, partial [Anaerolineaceae bacterium]|nr:type II CAAX endopeptidase family protein [Anaerolineaceae bacterium]